jgi:hypothetical protein
MYKKGRTSTGRNPPQLKLQFPYRIKKTIAMKKLIFLLLITFALNGCDNNNDKPKTELEKLPLATQTGANTAGCLVNGMAFLPKGNFPTLICNYNDGANFSLFIKERIIQGSNENIRTINVFSYNQNLHDNVGVAFPLTVYGSNSKSGEYITYNTDLGEIHYVTNSEVTGELKITYHNYNQAIISGTFWFDAINSTGQKVEVRNGRFDMHY